MEEVVMELAKLKVGADYWFIHKRKGRFRGTLKSISPPSEGDTQDSVILTVAIDTSVNGRPDLARTRGAIVTLTGIRPSLLLDVEEVRYEAPETQVETKQTEEKKRNFLSKLLGRKG
jgi:hypothetical protein